jgi:DNA-binding PadR family transcriptional regulator
MKNRVTSRLSPEFALLGFLYKDADHGYELHQRLRDEFENIWHASQSQTYSILKRLEAQGYVRSIAIEQEKLPSKQVLKITELGRKRFDEWLNRPSKSSVHTIRVEFLTRLYFTELYYPQNTEEMIGAQTEVVEGGVRELQARLANIPAEQIFDRLAVELRIKLLSSVISWLNGCQQAFNARMIK